MYMKGHGLPEHDRHFLGLVARAAFANPFSRKRQDLEWQMLEAVGAGPGGLSREDIGDRAIEAVKDRVAQISRRHGMRLDHYRGIDRKLMRTAFLFNLFHRFLADFDRLIEEQIGSRSRSCAVPFAGEILSLLAGHDFPRDESLRYLGFFFQLRRAYFFIRRGLVGESPSMKELRRQLWDSVFTSDVRWYEQYLWDRMEDFSTLLLGETGTGKGTAAAAIGRSIYIPFDEKSGCFAESFTRNFVSVNLSRFPETLIESELFGHRKGSFTGAIENYAGLFARCSAYGAVFLDEIGDVSVPVQVKLLQVLQERTFSPVGSHESLQFPSRVIAATNKRLEDLRGRGEMRDDFYYRLCSNTIEVPPLRTRISENPVELDLLLEHVLQRTLGRRSPELARSVRRLLHEAVGDDYPWPGNVRELEQAVRRVLITRSYGETAVPAPADRRRGLLEAIDRGEADAYRMLSDYCILLYEKYGTYEAVARITRLDRRTVKKYVETALRSGEVPPAPVST